MIVLSAFDLGPLSGRLARLRRLKDFAERQALLEAVDADDAARAVSSPRRMPTSRAAALRSALPYSGPATPTPQARSLAEEEWAIGKAAAAKGGRLELPGAASSIATAPPPLRAASDAGGSQPRSPIAAKIGLANGAQAAVVKLASYGSGAGRAGSLLNYQSHKGELSLEREDGSFVTGKEAIADLARHWRGDEDRAPSNDVLAVTMTFAGQVGEAESRSTLETALPGHKYVWRLESIEEETRVHLVAVAAGSRRDANGRLDRIFANARSEDLFFTKVEQAFGHEAEFSEVQWSHGVEGATTRLAALTKAGQFSAETESGLSLEAAADGLFSKKPSNSERAKPKGFNPALEIAKSWKPAMRSSAPRDFAHVIFSAKPGTDKEAFMDAARATLAKEFVGHEYVFVMHTNRQHIHVHAAVRLTSPTGEKLHPGIQDFNRWRATLAEEARERNIPMEAVRRFDQAHAPAYRLKDVKMVERGHAPPNVRRRIERVQNHDIFSPTREEGRRRAQEAARQWRGIAGEASRSTVPPPAPGALRLYRWDDDKNHRGALYAVDMALAASFAKPKSAARMVYVDVPASRLGELMPSRSRPGEIFVVPRAIGAESKPYEAATSASVLHFRQRTEAALSNSPQVRLSKETFSMRTAETMTTARDGMAETLAQIGALLPDDGARSQFERQSQRLLDKADEAIAAQKRLERESAEVLGAAYVKPEAKRDLGPIITHERKGDEIHYHRHDATGALQTLAFVDKGKNLDIRDWSNVDSVHAALKLASEKWDVISVSGSDAYKETVARLAAQHGYRVTNPELQDRIKEFRAEFERDRVDVAGGEARQDGKGERQHQTDPATPDTAEAAAAPGPRPTPAELELRLQNIRGRVAREAGRETEQAAKADVAREFNAAQGTEQTPYRTQREAESAREAQRAIENDSQREIPADLRQSEAMQALRQQQARVLNEEQEQRRIDIENARRINQELQQRRRSESEGESQ